MKESSECKKCNDWLMDHPTKILEVVSTSLAHSPERNMPFSLSVIPNHDVAITTNSVMDTCKVAALATVEEQDEIACNDAMSGVDHQGKVNSPLVLQKKDVEDQLDAFCKFSVSEHAFGGTTVAENIR